MRNDYANWKSLNSGHADVDTFVSRNAIELIRGSGRFGVVKNHRVRCLLINPNVDLSNRVRGRERRMHWEQCSYNAAVTRSNRWRRGATAFG